MKAYQKFALITGLLSAPLCADTIVLKSGIEYQGKVISEDATNYLVEINVTKSIKDEKSIPKADVKEIRKESAESAEKADFEKVGILVPTPDQLSGQNYQERIQKAESFITAYPRSTHTEKLKEALSILKEEYTVITAGGTKLGGKLITAKDLKMDSYDIHAQLIYHDFKKLSAQKRYLSALKKWDSLKKEYRHSSAYVKSLPQATRVLQSYQDQLNKDLESLASRSMKRKATLSRLDANERKRVENAIAQKEARLKAIMEQEKASRHNVWLTTDNFDAAAMKANLRSTERELLRLEHLDPSKIRLAGPVLRSLWEALESDDLAQVTKKIGALHKFRLGDQYTEPLHTMLKDKQTMKKAEKAAATTAEAEALKAKESMTDKDETMTDKEQK